MDLLSDFLYVVPAVALLTVGLIARVALNGYVCCLRCRGTVGVEQHVSSVLRNIELVGNAAYERHRCAREAVAGGTAPVRAVDRAGPARVIGEVDGVGVGVVRISNVGRRGLIGAAVVAPRPGLIVVDLADLHSDIVCLVVSAVVEHYHVVVVGNKHAPCAAVAVFHRSAVPYGGL